MTEKEMKQLEEEGFDEEDEYNYEIFAPIFLNTTEEQKKELQKKIGWKPEKEGEYLELT